MEEEDVAWVGARSSPEAHPVPGVWSVEPDMPVETDSPDGGIPVFDDDDDAAPAPESFVEPTELCMLADAIPGGSTVLDHYGGGDDGEGGVVLRLDRGLLEPTDADDVPVTLDELAAARDNDEHRKDAETAAAIEGIADHLSKSLGVPRDNPVVATKRTRTAPDPVDDLTAHFERTTIAGKMLSTDHPCIMWPAEDDKVAIFTVTDTYALAYRFGTDTLVIRPIEPSRAPGSGMFEFGGPVELQESQGYNPNALPFTSHAGTNAYGILTTLGELQIWAPTTGGLLHRCYLTQNPRDPKSHVVAPVGFALSDQFAVVIEAPTETKSRVHVTAWRAGYDSTFCFETRIVGIESMAFCDTYTLWMCTHNGPAILDLRAPPWARCVVPWYQWTHTMISDADRATHAEFLAGWTHHIGLFTAGLGKWISEYRDEFIGERDSACRFVPELIPVVHALRNTPFVTLGEEARGHAICVDQEPHVIMCTSSAVFWSNPIKSTIVPIPDIKVHALAALAAMNPPLTRAPPPPLSRTERWRARWAPGLWCSGAWRTSRLWTLPRTRRRRPPA